MACLTAPAVVSSASATTPDRWPSTVARQNACHVRFSNSGRIRARVRLTRMVFSWSSVSGMLLASLAGIARKRSWASEPPVAAGCRFCRRTWSTTLLRSDRAQPAAKTAARPVPPKTVDVHCHCAEYLLANIRAILPPDAGTATPVEDQVAIDPYQPPPGCLVPALQTIQQAGRGGTWRVDTGRHRVLLQRGATAELWHAHKRSVILTF